MTKTRTSSRNPARQYPRTPVLKCVRWLFPVVIHHAMFSRALASPSTSSAVVSLVEPLTRSSLARINQALSEYYPRQHEKILNEKEIHAAVLIPLCNVNNRPGVLLEVRGKALRSHSGEVRCIELFMSIPVSAVLTNNDFSKFSRRSR